MAKNKQRKVNRSREVKFDTLIADNLSDYDGERKDHGIFNVKFAIGELTKTLSMTGNVIKQLLEEDIVVTCNRLVDFDYNINGKDIVITLKKAADKELNFTVVYDV